MNKSNMKKIMAVLVSGMLAGAASADTMNGSMPDTQTNTTVTSSGTTHVSARSDAEITMDVKKALADYMDKLTVSVQGGVVMLSGELPSDTDYDKVVTMAQSIKGVGDVNADGLTVTSSQNPLTDTYITAKVKGSLIQYDLFTADIPSWTIGVETKNGQVHLSGTVKSQQDLDKIVQIAEKVKGVKEVDNKMVVNGSDDEMKQNGNGDATDNGNGTDSSN